jgi:two-component system response regulator HydG
VDVRLIAATNRDLLHEVASGRFRSDLYYRLNVAEIVLPPLQQRREDIPYLTAAFVQNFAQRFSKPLVGLTSGAERLLAEAPWEGNVRQLRNVLERACILADGEFVTEAELGGIMRQQMQGTSTKAPAAALPAMHRTVPLVEIEREHIVRTLEQVGGNKAVAARLLGISRRAFYRQLERHGLHTSIPLLKAATEQAIVPLGRVS